MCVVLLLLRAKRVVEQVSGEKMNGFMKTVDLFKYLDDVVQRRLMEQSNAVIVDQIKSSVVEIVSAFFPEANRQTKEERVRMLDRVVWSVVSRAL